MQNSASMDLSKAVASLALLCGLLLVVGYSRAQPQPIESVIAMPTAHQKVEAREMKRKAAMVEQQRRRGEFERLCRKAMMSPAELETCRVAYREL